MSIDPIEAVSVVSTGTVCIRPEHVGPTSKPLYVWLMTSRRWTAPRPINVYVIQHRQGLVLFDTGQDRRSVTDPRYFPGGFAGLVYRRLATFDIDPSSSLPTKLRTLGHTVSDVHTVVLSHLHQDHIGGLPDLPPARLLIDKAEWEAMRAPRSVYNGYLRDHIELSGLRWSFVEYEPLSDQSAAPFTSGHDVFGDGSIVIVPTPGHSQGSLSAIIRRPGRAPILLCGDLTYDVRLLAEGKAPGVGDRRQLRASIALVNEFQRRNHGLAVLAAHDPGAAAALDRMTTDPGP
jgi:glyoxylase-like metal-dependent hydrolase (beta-lactamase superfamily II)